MRLPYAPQEAPADASENTTAIYARIAARRAPRPVTKLDRALLHNASVADGWNGLLGAIRTGTSLSQAIMELAICRIAVLNGATYEWSAHAPLARKAGVTKEELEVVRVAEVGEAVAQCQEGHGKEGRGSESKLSPEQWAVLAYTDQMTRDIKVQDGVFEKLKEFFSDTQVVELTATVASYNMVSRFLVALDVCEMNGQEIVVPE